MKAEGEDERKGRKVLPGPDVGRQNLKDVKFCDESFGDIADKYFGLLLTAVTATAKPRLASKSAIILPLLTALHSPSRLPFSIFLILGCSLSSDALVLTKSPKTAMATF